MNAVEETTITGLPELELTELTITQPRGIVSNELRLLIEQIMYIFTCTICLVGVTTNAINIMVFYKQGLRTDCSNIGLFSLAVSDLAGCFFILPSTVCRMGGFALSQAFFKTCLAMTNMSFQYPHVLFSKITCWLTVYITVERCLIVTKPLQFNKLITPRVTATAVISVYTLFVVLYTPYPFTTRIVMVFDEALNATIAATVESPLGKIIVYILAMSTGTVLTFVATFITAVSTTVMIYKLKISSKTRDSMTGNTTGIQSAKDRTVVKSVTMITAMFLACASMTYFPSIAMSTLPGMTVSGHNHNLFFLIYGWKFLFDSINSSANFFFFINVSSRYRATFDSIFRKNRLENTGK